MMLLFLLALVIGLVGIGAYAYYDPGAHDITVRSYHFIGVPDWTPPAIAAGAMLFFFLVHAVYAGARIRRLRRANEGTRLPSNRFA